MSDLRVVGLRFEVDVGDGKTKIVQMRRAISDTTATVDRLNQELGDNVRVSTEKIQTDKEIVQQARLIVSQEERQRRKTAEVVKQYESLNQTIKQYGNDFETVNAIVRLGSNATEQQKQQVAELVREYQNLRNAGDKAGGSFRNLRGVSQQFGWQLADVAVQAQMGTSWFTIIAQQGSQMAAAFGAAGAIIGGFIAVGFAVMPTVLEWLGKASVSSRELEEAHSKLNTTLNTTDYTVSGVTRQLYELYKIDSQLARLKLLGALHESETAMSGFKQNMEDMLKSTLRVVDNYQKTIERGIVPNLPDELVGEYQKTLETMGRSLDKQAEKLGINRDELVRLGSAYKTFLDTGDVTGLTDAFGDLSQNTSRLTPAFKKLVSEYAELAARGLLTQRQQEELNRLLSESTYITDSYSGSIESLADRYARMRRQLEMNERQVTVDNFLRNEAKKLSEEEIKSTVRAMNSYYDEKDAIDARNRAIEDAKKLDDERIKQRESLLKPIEQSLIVSSNNPVIAEVERNKKVMDTLQAQMQNTKEYEYSERARINKLIQLEEEKHIKALTEAQFQLASNQVAVIGSTVEFMSRLTDEMFDGGERVREQMEEMSGFQKAMFFLTRSILATEALINGIALGGKLALQFPTAAPAMVTFGTSLGAANAGAIMGATFAGAFDNGGYIPSGQWGIASEYGDELVNGVMVRGPADITSRVDTAAMTQGGLNVTVENYASGVSHQVQQIDENTVRIIATQVFNQNIDKGVSGVLGKKGTKANKTLTGNYDVRGRV